MERVCAKSIRGLAHLFLGLAVAVLAATSAFGQTPVPTNIQISNTVLQSNVTRLGINLGDQTYWDSGQMMKNLVFRNPGFEGMVYRSILTCGTVTANSCMDTNQWSGHPTGFWTGGTYEVLSGASMGVTGTVVSSTKNPNSCNNCGQIVVFDKNLSLAAKDYVVVRNTFPGNAQAGWWPNTSGGGTLTTDLTDLSPETPGKQALSMNAAGTGMSAGVTSWFDTWTGKSFVQLNGAFQVTFRAKGTGGTNLLQVSLQRLMSGLPTYLSKTVTLTNAWQDYTLSFAAAETGSAIGNVGLTFSASGANVLLDDVSLIQTNSNPANTTAFRDDVVDALVALKPGVIRMMASYAQIGAELQDQIAPPFARYREGYSTTSPEVDDIPFGIHEFFQLCALVGADPWITIPTATTPQEMTAFIQYLIGTGSDPNSALRIARGQSAPWTSVFHKIHLELGNETWNTGSFPGETMFYTPYPLWANQVFGAARKTPGYIPSQFDLVLGGWAGSSWYTGQILAASTQHDSIDVAPYLLYSANNDTTANLFQSLFAEPEVFDSPGGQVFSAAQAATSATIPTRLNIYEVNLGTMVGNITQLQLDALTPSVGAGIATADHMLQMMRVGAATQNMFALSQFEFGRSDRSMVRLWGAVVDMGNTHRKRPQYLSEQLANSAIFGNMLQTTQTGLNPTWNQPLSSDNVQLANAHLIQSFAFSDGHQSSIVLFNLALATALPVTFSGTVVPTGSVQISQLTSANITDSNESSNVVQTTTSTESGFNATSPLLLPAFSMTVLTWPGGPAASLPSAASPAFSIQAGSYLAPISVALSDATTASTIYYTLDGSTPTSASRIYTGPIPIAASQTVRALASATGYSNSAVVSATYVIVPFASTPTISPAGGVFAGPQTITLADATAGAVIHYTLNGSTPTVASPTYTGPFTAAVPAIIQAIAIASSYQNSTMATATLNALVPTAPSFSPAAGTYASAQQVTLSDATPGATLYYSTNGSTSAATWLPYAGPISVNTSEALSAMAVLGQTPSSPASAVYTITPPPINFPAGFSASGLHLNINASLVGTALQLTRNAPTQIGTAWFPTPISVKQFTTDFTFQITNAVADGFTFSIQNSPQGYWAVGGNGGYLGYQSISKSLAVKFNFYNGNTTGLMINRASPAPTSYDMSAAGINLRSGDVFHAHLVYDGTTLTLTLTDTKTKAVFTKAFPINVTSTIGANSAYVGFTGATGAKSATQQILSWTYTPSL